MKKKKKNNKKKIDKVLIIEKQANETKEKREGLEEEINKILDDLTLEELNELEEMGDFSKEALEWIRARKRLKKAKKVEEEFLKRIRVSDEIIRRSIIMGKLAGLKNGDYKPSSKREEDLLRMLAEEQNQDMERGDRERDQERAPGGGRDKSGGQREDDRQR